MSRFHNLEYKWLVAIVFVSGLFMELLDTTIVNVALPTLATEFDANVAQLEWVVTGYLLSLAVWIPASGWLGDRFGTKRIFMLALAIFTLSSALCAAAWSIESLIGFRIMQGVGGGMLTPVGTAMLFRAFPPHERSKASAVLTAPVSIAPALGPIIGGLMVDNLSWHWIFLVNVPIGILALIFAGKFLQEHTEPTVGPFDLAGFLLSASSIPMMIYALSRGPYDGWTSTKVLGIGLTGIVLFFVMIYVETHKPDPMLALRLFKDRMFRSANIVYFVAMVGLVGVIFLLPLFLQSLKGFSATESGLTTFPQAIGIALVAQPVSRLYPRIGPRRLLAAGMLGIALTTFAFLLVDLDTGPWPIRLIMLLRGIAFGTVLIPLQAATFATISRADSGRASALFSTTRQVASSFGVAILATVLVERTQHYVGQLSASDVAAGTPEAALKGFHDAYLVGGLFALLGFGLCFLIKDSDAIDSMRPKEGAHH